MKNLYSPSMLKSYLSCKYTIFNEIHEKKLKLKKIEISKNDQLRLAKGDEHEEKSLLRKFATRVKHSYSFALYVKKPLRICVLKEMFNIS